MNNMLKKDQVEMLNVCLSKNKIKIILKKIISKKEVVYYSILE